MLKQNVIKMLDNLMDEFMEEQGRKLPHSDDAYQAYKDKYYYRGAFNAYGDIIRKIETYQNRLR